MIALGFFTNQANKRPMPPHCKIPKSANYPVERTTHAPAQRARLQEGRRKKRTWQATISAYRAAGVSNFGAATVAPVPIRPSKASGESPPWLYSDDGFACECAGAASPSRHYRDQEEWMEWVAWAWLSISSTSAPHVSRHATRKPTTSYGVGADHCGMRDGCFSKWLVSYRRSFPVMPSSAESDHISPWPVSNSPLPLRSNQ